MKSEDYYYNLWKPLFDFLDELEIGYDPTDETDIQKFCLEDTETREVEVTITHYENQPKSRANEMYISTRTQVDKLRLPTMNDPGSPAGWKAEPPQYYEGHMEYLIKILRDKYI